MYVMNLAALIGIVTIRYISASGFSSFSRFTTSQHYANPALTVLDVTLVQCVELCQRTATCRSVGYCSDTSTCEVNEVSPTDISVPSTLSSAWIIFYRSEYDIMSGAIATMGSTNCPGGTCYDASLAIDGNTNGDLHQNSCAQSELSPTTWTVELRAPVHVHRVIIFFRTDCCFSEFKNILIRVQETEGSTGSVCNAFMGPPAALSENPITITCHGGSVYGKYVQIGYAHNQPLTICEVAVLNY